MPPPTWPTFPPAPPPKKPKTRLIIGIVLLALLVGGVAVYAAYQNNQQQILRVAKNSEQGAASQVPSEVQFTCFNSTIDKSHLPPPSYGGYTYGYLGIVEKFGLSNPSQFAVDATWTITIDYRLIALVLADTEFFHMPANGAAHPIFTFKITAAQLNSLSGTTSSQFQNFTVALDGNYAVTGIYSTYHPTQQLNYDSTTNAGSGSLGSSSTLPNC